MLTWRLWRALRYPDENNPLFARIQEQPSHIPGRRFLARLEPLASTIALFATVGLMVIAPFVLLLTANLFGALVAFNVTDAINREREGGTYDLLALTPSGLGASNWQIAAACATRLNVIERLASLRTLCVATLFLVLIYALSGATITPIPVVAALFAFNVDAIQAQIVGCLSGMLAQVFSNRSATFASVAIFVFVELILVYLPVTMIGIALLGAVRSLPVDRWIGEGIVALAVVAALFVLREAIIRTLWRELERRLL